MGGKGHHPSSSESDDWGDESWIVDCPCGVNFDDGEEMVECDVCNVWVHTVCCRVHKGLPTYICDKCKAKKKQKETEESEVAQLLVELPSKTVCFEEKAVDKVEPYSGHHTSSEIPIEARAHVNGIPGGDPSFFEGVSKVFCRQLWKHAGYVPKHLKVDCKELPDTHEDISQLLRDLPNMEGPTFGDDRRKFIHLIRGNGQENGHAYLPPRLEVHSCSREGDFFQEDAEKEVQKEAGGVFDDAFRDKQGKSNQGKKVEGKHNKHRHKPKVKEEKSHSHVKRGRDDGSLKEQTSKKKTKSSGDAYKLEDGQGKVSKLDGSSQEVGLLAKSPQSSPKNPKAMKKLAVREFMDGNVRVCCRCYEVEHMVAHAVFLNGGSTCARSDWICLECERFEGGGTPAAPQLESGNLKQDPVTTNVTTLSNHETTLNVALVPRKELNNCEIDFKDLRSRDEHKQGFVGRESQPNSGLPFRGTAIDPSSDVKMADVDWTEVHKGNARLSNMKEAEFREQSAMKLELPALTAAKHSDLEREAGEILEGSELSATRTTTALKSRSDITGKDTVLTPADSVSATKSNQAAPLERHTSVDLITLGGTRNLVSVCSGEGQVIGLLPGHAEIPTKVAQVSPGHPVVASVVAEGAGVSDIQDSEKSEKIATGSVKSPFVTVANTVAEEKASKFVAQAATSETRGQGSARTAGHLPASVREKLLADRSNHNQHLHRTTAGSQHHGGSLPGQSHGQTSSPTIQRLGSSDCVIGSLASKSSIEEDSLVPKLFMQGQQENSGQALQVKQTQQARSPQPFPDGGLRHQPGLPDISSISSSSSAQRAETEQIPRGLPSAVVDEARTDGLNPASSPQQPQSCCSSMESPEQKSSLPMHVTICQQARQINGIGHVFSRKAHTMPSQTSTTLGSMNQPQGATGSGRFLGTTASNVKPIVSLLKSPSTGTLSSSPTSPLVTTPSSKPQPMCVKVPGSPPAQRSVSGGSTPKASNSFLPPSKLPSSGTLSTSSGKPVGSLHSSKSVPNHPASPPPVKVTNVVKQSSRSTSLPSAKSADASNSASKSSSATLSSRSGNQGGSGSSGLAKDSAKNALQSGSKVSVAGKIIPQPTLNKPPSSLKVSHAHGTAKVGGSSGSKQPPVTSKSSALPPTVKPSAAQQSKGGTPQKEEKSSIPLAPPIPKAMSTMPPPPPQVASKRSPPTVLTNSAATTLKDEELAILLHQELNSSPRVPRVPRVRQAGASLQLASSAQLSTSSGKGSTGSASRVGHKDHPLAPRKRTREDRHKESIKSSSLTTEEVVKGGSKKQEEMKPEDGRSVSSCGLPDGSIAKEKHSALVLQSTTEGSVRHHAFGKGNLSIIVPDGDEIPDGEKKSPVDNSAATLPGLIDEVLGSKGHRLSYEDVCEAVLPHWPKLRKPNGERYAYASHRQAVLDCLRNRLAWSHLVERGPKTNVGRKRWRSDSSTLSDTDIDDDEDRLTCRDYDELETSKSSKRFRDIEGENWEADVSIVQKNVDVTISEDVPKGKRKARRRRRVAIEEGTDGEEEPTNRVETVSHGMKGTHDKGAIQDDEPEVISSPSSEEAVSNYSEEDEEMVVHRGMRNKRRHLGDEESSGSEDDMD